MFDIQYYLVSVGLFSFYFHFGLFPIAVSPFRHFICYLLSIIRHVIMHFLFGFSAICIPLLLSFPPTTIAGVLSYPYDDLPTFPILSRATGSNSSTNGTKSSGSTCQSGFNKGQFLYSGTFCPIDNSTDTNTTIICPGPVSSGECLALSLCFLPAGLNKAPPPPDNSSDSSQCSSSVSILTVLAVVNIVEAASNLIQGHDNVRNKLFSFRKYLHLKDQSEFWGPRAGLMAALWTFIPNVLISGIQSWAENKKQFSFGSILGMYALRPRGTFLVFTMIRLTGWGGFKFTAFDSIVTESILDVVALPWALTFVLTNHGKDSDGAKGCGIEGYEPSDDGRVGLAYSSFGWSSFAGVVSSLVLAQFVVMSFNKKLSKEDMSDKDEFEVDGHSWLRRVLWREKRQWVPLVVAMGTFISNWVLWGRKFISFFGGDDE